MMRQSIGENLVEAAGKTTSEAVLIAPFIKVGALTRILERLSSKVSVTVFARWIPGEIAAGVCDLEIYDLLVARENSFLFVHSLLHAKSYRFDETIFIGSANLTGKALGWAHPSNLEILAATPDLLNESLALEMHLRATAIHVDAAYRDEIAKMVELLADHVPIDPSFFQAHHSTMNNSWLPTCREPKRIWSVYSSPSEARRRIVESAYRAASEDIWRLQLEDGLSYSEFEESVATALIKLPIVSDISQRAISGITETDAIKLISTHTSSIDTANEQWEILREWLIEFFPNVYRHEPLSGSFRVARIVG